MSVVDSTTEASAVGVGSKNVQFAISGENLTRKVVVIATHDPLKTEVVPNVPILVLNEADAGDKAGFGYPAHRIIKSVFKGSQGAGELWWVPQVQTGTASAGEIAWVGGPTTKAGTINLRIGGELYPVVIPLGSTIEEISDLVVAFVNNIADTPLVAAKTAVTFETTFTAKALGLEGDKITISINRDQKEVLPEGLTSAIITGMAGGAGAPDIQDALDGLGTGDDANQKWFTHMVHGNGLDTATIDKVSAYLGEGNDFVGCYSKLVSRPFRCLSGDITPDAAGLTALQVITDARLSDRANGICAAPDSDGIPSEIAGLAAGIMARISQNNPAEHYSGKILSGVYAGESASRWTKDLSERDIAVKSGISPTRAISEELFLQNIVTFYRPVSVPSGSNGFKSFRSAAVEADILNKFRETFEAEVWQGVFIVADKSKVTDIEAKKKARSTLDVKTAINNLADFFEKKGFIFDAAFSKKNSEVALRALSNGFDVNFKWKMSGEAQVYNIQSSFDINIAG